MAATAAADCGKRVRRGERRVYEYVPAGEQHRVSGAAPAVGGGVPVLLGAEEAGEGRGLQERGCVRVRVRGKKIVFEGGEIRLMDGKRNPVTIQVREFERRPNAEFRRVMGYVGKVNA